MLYRTGGLNRFLLAILTDEVLMTQEMKNKILHDLRKIALAIKELIEDLDDASKEIK